MSVLLRKLSRLVSVVVMTLRRRLDEIALLPTKRISFTPVFSPSTIEKTTSMRPFGRSDAGRDLSETATGAAVDLQDALNVCVDDRLVVGPRALVDFGLEDRPIDAAIALERDPVDDGALADADDYLTRRACAHAREHSGGEKIAARLLGEPAPGRRYRTNGFGIDAAVSLDHHLLGERPFRNADPCQEGGERDGGDASRFTGRSSSASSVARLLIFASGGFRPEWIGATLVRTACTKFK